MGENPFKTGEEIEETGTRSPRYGDAALVAIYGIGEVLAEEFVDAEYYTALDVANAEAEELATDVESISQARAEDFITAARTMLGKWPDREYE